MTCGIYEILNTVNGKRYIGQAADMKRRWREHRRHLDAGSHHSPKLQLAWNKHGAGAFEFLQVLTCMPSMLDFYEQQLFDATAPQYNIYLTAGSPRGHKHSDEFRQRQRVLNLGRRHSIGAKQRISASLTGRVRPPFSDEWRANLVASRLGKSRGPYKTQAVPSQKQIDAAARSRGKPKGPFTEAHRASIAAAAQIAYRARSRGLDGRFA